MKSRGSSDDGFTLPELLLASALGAVVFASALVWLIVTITSSDKLMEGHDDDRELSLILDAVIAEISEARPTALCLDPDPNLYDPDSDHTTLDDPATSSSCNRSGDNWGYWQKVSATAAELRSGGPFREAKEDELCYFALPDGTVPDPATPQSPWGACVNVDGGRLLARTLEPESDAKSDYLAAAIPSNYSWASGTWTDRSLGLIDSIAFTYEGFDGTDLTPSSGNSIADDKLDEIAKITVTITRIEDGSENELSGTYSVQANRFSPCREVLTGYDASNSTTTSTVGPPDCPAASDPS